MKASRKVLVILAAGASLTAMAPAFADGWDYERGYGHWHHHEAGVVYSAPVYYGPPQVVYAPPPVYYGPPPVVYAPAPVYYGPPQVVYSQPAPARVYASSPNAGNVGGAIAGAVIGSRFGQGDGRLAATAIGAVLGSMIGGGM
ncbi:MAG TPA: glycine zipper 2TM domain-containing protein [Burkholderiales bacterium]|nr:glycine zipper 2TM domain-containing protein [Burkholderiales bacterium]